MLGRELRRIAKRAPLTLRLMLRAFNLHAREDSHGVTETQRRFTAGALPQTPKAGQSQAIDWRSGHGGMRRRSSASKGRFGDSRTRRVLKHPRTPSPIHLHFLHFLPITSDKITGFYGIYRIFLVLNPVNHDNPVILSKKHGSYPHLHSRAKRGRRTKSQLRKSPN